MQGFASMNSCDLVQEGVIQFQLSIHPVKSVIIGDCELKSGIRDSRAYFRRLWGTRTQTRAY